MRVGVLRTQVPFVSGGAERHAAGLVAALQRHGHTATEITLPFKWYPGEVLADHILAAKLTDLSEVEGVPVDRMIGLKFPAYLARHPAMQFWIMHQHRQAYDQWETGQSDLLDDPDGLSLRALVQAEDRAAFAASPHPIFANSVNVAGRLQRNLGIAARPLYHPPPQAEAMHTGSYGDYLLVPGRINPSKRLELVLEAFARTKTKLRLVIVGTAENPAYAQALYKQSLAPEMAGRIDWQGAVDDATLRRLYADARAVIFVPQDEDYGYITLEAMLAAKPVVTLSDAGGPLEFITHEQEGLVAAPSSADLAVCLDRLMQDPTLAETLGQGGHARYRRLKISWDHVVETLLGPSEGLRVDAPPAPPAPAVAAGAAVAQLRAAVAPPPSLPDLPFGSVTELLETYAFEELPAELGVPEPPIDAGFAAYLGTHWTRYLTTLAALQDLRPQEALDVGVFPPLIFQALLAARYPGIRMAGLWEGPNAYRQTIRTRADGQEAFTIQLDPANGERDPWPYPDASFDLVTGMEILEHLALDPHFFYAEANRVLRPGGHLLLTTPNVTSHRSLAKVLNGQSPYSFGIFVPSGGIYGRHNREYAPAELADLGQAAGFDTVALKTADVYGDDVTPEVAEMLVARQDMLRLRGENILYLARKTRPPGAAPAVLYHGDPRRMAARFHVAAAEMGQAPTALEIENTSADIWPVAGQGGTCLLAEWIDGQGVLIHQQLVQPLRAPVPPGARVSIPLPVSRDRAAPGQLRLHAYQIGVGVFTGRGRAAPVTLPCARLAFHAWLRALPAPVQAS